MQKIIAIVGGGERATHAVLAREALKMAARAQGTEILVELRTSDGVQDPLDPAAVQRADRLLLVGDVAGDAVPGGLPQVRVSIAEVLRMRPRCWPAAPARRRRPRRPRRPGR
ncbi:PTS sugar transporter subunit IIB [Paracoccus mutanolyticus]|uniref:hypothetical protein n=1 Tax=Paracoccus mutanolyticus TaxID=1499308 RepID=UPI001CB8A8A2|nr:hypothetical protein [Paracoccus mutanolyticus]